MVSAPLDVPVLRSGGERRVYMVAAMAAALVVFAGFAPTYYLKAWFDTPELTTLKHLHGLVMTTWFALFLGQASLVSMGRTELHRKVGVAGIVLAFIVLVVGIRLGIASARAGATPLPEISPLAFLVLPVGEMVTFAILFTAAILLRKRPPYHKRLMLVASVAMLAPAVARFPVEFIQHAGPPAFFGLVDLMIIGCIAYDTIRNRKLHPAFAAGLAVVIVGQAMRFPLSQTAAWMAFAKWLVG